MAVFGVAVLPWRTVAAYAQPVETAEAMVELTMTENRVIRPDPNLPAGQGETIRYTVRYEVKPAYVSLGQKISIKRTSTLVWPTVNYTPQGKVCRNSRSDKLTGPSYTWRFDQVADDGFRIYRMTNDRQPYLAGDGESVTGRVVEPARITEQSYGNCRFISSSTTTGVFYIDTPGTYFVSLGVPRLKKITANGKKVDPAAVNFKISGELPIVGVRPLPPVTAKSEAEKRCQIKSGGKPLTPFSSPKLYRQEQLTICTEAVRFGLSPVLLAILLQHEGEGRAKYIQGRVDKWIENQFPIHNDTVGTAQMRPDVARARAAEFDGIELTLDDARNRLVYDTKFAIHMATAELFHLQSTYGLTDREAFIAYSGGDAAVYEFRRTNFSGKYGKDRGEKYDQLYHEIAGKAGYPHI
jgi:hypothetical protein